MKIFQHTLLVYYQKSRKTKLGRCSSSLSTPRGANEPVTDRKSSPRAAAGHDRNTVCFGADACVQRAPSAAQIMSAAEQEEELKGTKRKMSLSK